VAERWVKIEISKEALLELGNPPPWWIRNVEPLTDIKLWFGAEICSGSRDEK